MRASRCWSRSWGGVGSRPTPMPRRRACASVDICRWHSASPPPTCTFIRETAAPTPAVSSWRPRSRATVVARYGPLSESRTAVLTMMSDGLSGYSALSKGSTSHVRPPPRCWGSEPEESERLLGDLVTSNLIESVHPGHFRMHPLLLDNAKDQVKSEEDEETRRQRDLRGALQRSNHTQGDHLRALGPRHPQPA